MCLLREEYVLDVSGILLGTVTNFVLMDSNSISSGKRDGMSKEGSGRVAVYKATGLIKCYTLEGNYNTGKTVNVLPPHGKDLTARKSNLPVPKYTPAIFEEVKIGVFQFHHTTSNLFFCFFSSSSGLEGRSCARPIDPRSDQFESDVAHPELRIPIRPRFASSAAHRDRARSKVLVGV